MLSTEGGANVLRLLKQQVIHETTPISPERVRPLGVFSDFVVENLGLLNAQIREEQVAPTVLFDQAEAFVQEIPEERFQELLKPDNIQNRRIAILDLVWVIRSLDIAYGNTMNTSEEYKQRRNA